MTAISIGGGPAIFYVLWTGCQWKTLPRSVRTGSTVHDRI